MTRNDQNPSKERWTLLLLWMGELSTYDYLRRNYLHNERVEDLQILMRSWSQHVGKIINSSITNILSSFYLLIIPKQILWIVELCWLNLAVGWIFFVSLSAWASHLILDLTLKDFLSMKKIFIYFSGLIQMRWIVSENSLLSNRDRRYLILFSQLEIFWKNISKNQL